MNELHINIGNGKVSPTIVINTLYNDNKSKTEIVLDRVINNDSEINKKVNVKGDIVVENINNIKINVASCCKPIPGDEIVGYISKGHGINVHRTICPNIADLEERIIEVKWNNTITKKYATNILITANINNELLVKIINKTSNSDINIQSINTINSPGRFMFDINLLVEDKDKLDKFIADISSIPEVISVDRIIK